MSEQEKTRREALKLAAAVAAFGTALGYRQTAEAAGTTAPAAGKTEIKQELKHEIKLELKLFADGRLVHNCPIPAASLRQIKLDGAKLEHKLYAGGKPVDTAAAFDLKAHIKK